MVLIDNGPKTIALNVPDTIFQATAGQLPGIFAGKIRTQNILEGDSLLIQMYGKTAPNGTEDAEVSLIIKSGETRFYLTPLEATSWYRIVVTLQGANPNLDLDYEITRSDS